jgi:bifunctional non-homologous end joining protein LigD
VVGSLRYACGVSFEPIAPMLATLASELPSGPGWSYEVKWDGYRAMLMKQGKRARLVSRNLKDLTSNYRHIADAASAMTPDDVVLDGEVVALDQHGAPSFQALQHRHVGRAAVVFYAFDLLRLGETDFRRQPLRVRRNALDGLRFSPPILRSEPLPGTVRQIERVVREAGLEGVVAKRLESLYEPGRRTPNWIKVKFDQRREFVVGGFKPAGTSFDSVLVGYYDRRSLLYAGKVRAGFTAHTRRELWSLIAADRMEACPFANLPNSVGRSHWGEGITAEDMPLLRWVAPRVVIDVTFTEWTAGGNLRHAKYVGLRPDIAARAVGRAG